MWPFSSNKPAISVVSIAGPKSKADSKPTLTSAVADHLREHCQAPEKRKELYLLLSCLATDYRGMLEVLVKNTQERVVERNQHAHAAGVKEIPDAAMAEHIGDMIVGAFVDAKLREELNDQQIEAKDIFLSINRAMEDRHKESEAAWRKRKNIKPTTEKQPPHL